MINCPKCNLLQPKDQYCAQCGINMESWRPPEQPGWKKLFGNWIFQLGVLFVLVFLVVLRDVFFTKRPLPTPEPSTVISENYEPLSQDSQSSANYAQESAPPPEETAPAPETPAAPDLRKLRAEKSPSETKQKIAALEKRANFQVIFLRRSLVERLFQSSKRVDTNAAVITKDDYLKITEASKGIKTIGSESREFSFNQPRQFFIGETDTETGIGFGFYLQLRVAESSQPSAIIFEANSWYQLKLNGEQGPQASYDVTMPADSYLIAVDPTMGDVPFSPEERSLFDSSDRLRSLNSESFTNDLSDIALVLSIH